MLEAAAEVFARKGYAGASVDDIAETAGFSTGALYSNFAGKDELFSELLNSRSSSRVAEAAELVLQRTDDIEQAQAVMSRHLIEVADKDMDIAALQAEFWLYAIRRPEFQKQLAAQLRGNRDGLAGVLGERARMRGRSADMPFDEVATILMVLFQGLVQLRRTDASLVPDDLYGTAARRLLAGFNASAAQAAADSTEESARDSAATD